MNRVLVTGGLGYIGSHTIVELSNKGYTPVIVDNLSNSRIGILERLNELTNSKLEYHKIDLSDKVKTESLFQQIELDAVIHFAASKAVGESVENPLLYYRNNLDSLINVINGCLFNGVKKLIFSSSCTVYGQPEILPVTENTPIQPAESPYGNTKQIGEEILEDLCKSQHNFRAISLRYFNPVGAHESGKIGELPLGVPNNLVPYITQTAIGIRDQLNVFGGDYDTPDGTCIRDYIHVVDLAKAHIAAVEHTDKMETNYEFFNVGTGRGASVLEVINAFEKVNGEKVDYKIVDRRPGDIEKIYAETSKANSILGWKAELNLEDMMRSVWQWQKAIQENPVE